MRYESSSELRLVHTRPILCSPYIVNQTRHQSLRLRNHRSVRGNEEEARKEEEWFVLDEVIKLQTHSATFVTRSRDRVMISLMPVTVLILPSFTGRRYAQLIPTHPIQLTRTRVITFRPNSHYCRIRRRPEQMQGNQGSRSSYLDSMSTLSSS